MTSSTSSFGTRALAAAVAVAAAVVLAFTASGRAAVVTLSTSSTALTSSTPLDSTAGLPVSGTTGAAAQVITSAFDPARLRLDGPGRVTAPEGWTTTFSSDGVTFGPAPASAAGWAEVRAVRTTGTVSGSASTGGTESQSVPAPASGAFSGGGGGDGWNVFFDDANHVFNIWHHNGSPWPGRGYGTIDCHTRTGATCGNGWPFDTTDGVLPLQTGMHSAGWVDAATGHLWFPTNTTGTATGFACVDVGNLGSGAGQGPAWCGGSATNAFRALGSGGPASYATDDYCNNNTARTYSCVEGLAVAGTRIYTVEARTGKVLCLDMAAAGGSGAGCVGQPYTVAGVTAVPWQIGLQGGGGIWLPALLNVNGMIFGTGRGSYSASNSAVTLFCLSGSTGEACPGWSPPKTIGDGASGNTTPWLTYAEPSASGGINGVCVRAVTRTVNNAPVCFALDGSTITGNSAIGGGALQPNGNENGTGAAATNGARVYWGNGTYNDNESRLYCWDAATDLACNGWPVTTETATGLANRDNYVITVDPLNDQCIWVNSDASGIYQYSSGGTRGCAGIPPGGATFTATNLVNPQRVSCGGGPTWGSLALTSPAQGTYAGATLTVLDAGGQVVTSGGSTWLNVPLTAAGTVSLSGLAQADTGSNPQFVVNLTGRTNSDAIATTLTAPAYPPELCATLTPQEVACPITGAPAGSLQAWTSPVTAEGSQGGSSLTSAQVDVAFSNAATAMCAAPPPPPGPSPPAPTAPTDPARPSVERPRLSPAGTAIVSVVRVATAGVITQAGLRGAGARACASRAVSVAQPGQVVLACRLQPTTIARLRRGPLRVRLVTTLRARAGGVSTSTRVITLRRTAVPVTG